MSAANQLHTARVYVRAAIAAYDADPRTCRVEMMAAERVLTEALDDLTPVNPAAPLTRWKSHESSSAFRAVGDILHEAKKKR